MDRTFNLNLRMSCSARIRPRLVPPTYIRALAHFWFYDQSRVYVAITTIVLRVHARLVATRVNHVCPISPRGRRHRRKFCRRAPPPGFRRGRDHRVNISAPGNIMKTSIADASALLLQGKGAGCVRDLHRCQLTAFTVATEVTRFPRGAGTRGGGRRCIVGR